MTKINCFNFWFEINFHLNMIGNYSLVAYDYNEIIPKANKKTFWLFEEKSSDIFRHHYERLLIYLVQ